MVNATTFTANGEYLVGGTTKDVQVWRVKDGERVATMPMEHKVVCVAASRDGRWIAAGTRVGELVWDTTTNEQVFADRSGSAIYDLDFSPDSTRLVSATYGPICTATIWDIASRQKVQTLDHDGPVDAAKYSPQGDRIATATSHSVWVWDSGNGGLLVDIKVQVKGRHSLVWCKNHLFVQTNDSKIKQIDGATGSIILEWLVPEAYPCIALPQHGNFIACSAKKTITLWDTATRSQFGLIQHTHDIPSIACSSDGQLLAIPSEKKIIVKDLSSVIFCSVSVRSVSCLYYISVSPRISGTV